MSQAVADVLTGTSDSVEPRDSAVAVTKRERWLALDVFRFFAVVMMVQGHVFTTLLDEATKDQGWYPHHAAFHGYTAPMFLFGAGLAFGYTTFKRWDSHTAGGAAAAKRYTRYLWLLVLGYGLQLPTLSLSGLLTMENPERIARFLQVNVLQHIGVSLAIAQILVRVVKRKRVFVSLMATLALLCVFAAPWVWNLDVSGLPVFVRGYINKAEYSYFPIVPWAGFTYGGIVVAYVFGVRGSAKEISDGAAWPFLALSLGFMLVPVVIDRLGYLPLPSHNFWKTNPLFFFWRLGNILFVLSLLCFVERFLRSRDWLNTDQHRVAGALVPWIKLLSAESLVIYVAHLLVLHGSVIAPGLTSSGTISRGGHGMVEAALITVAIMGLMVVITKAWTELRKQKTAFKVFQITVCGVLLLVALIR